jgi:hypothetical protein
MRKFMNHLSQNSAKRIALITLMCFSAVFIQPANAEEKLHHREVNQKNPAGKDLVMTFKETKREGDISTVKVTMTSGASVPSAMFIMRGIYDIDKIRKKNYLIKLSEKEEEDGSWTYRFAFTNDMKVNPQKHFNLKEPLPDDGGFTFMAVMDLDMIFKGQE